MVINHVLRIPVRKLKRAHLIGSNWPISEHWDNTVNLCSDQIISQTYCVHSMIRFRLIAAKAASENDKNFTSVGFGD